MKNAIEALGVPHTEIGRIEVNAGSATLDRIVREGDRIEVFPWPEVGAAPADMPLDFVADAHLGALARFLRMLGFDTVHDNRIADAEIRRLAYQDRRIVLTRDRELLKCREIARGAYVRALKPEAQLREVAGRYGLEAYARPFTRCLACNLPLQPVENAAVAARVPPAVLELHEHFVRCPGCNGVFWPGSHYRRMLSALRSSFDVPC